MPSELPPPSQYVERLLAPIPGGVPAGAPARLGEAFEKLASEVGQLDQPSGRPVEWVKVSQLAETILREQSKDLLVAAYLARGLLGRSGLEGFRDGLDCLAGLCRTYWEGMHPDVKRPQARANALEWVLEKTSIALGPSTEGAGDLTSIDLAISSAGALASLARERLGPACPAFGRLLAALERLRLDATPSAEEPTKPPAAAQPAPASPLESGGPGAAGHPPMERERPAVPLPTPPPPPAVAPALAYDGSEDFLSRAGEALVEAAQALRELDPTNPAPYRLLRAGLWLHLDTLPAATNGRTALGPPPEALVARLEQAAAERRWAALLSAAEHALTQHRFALDLHQQSWRALGELGPAFARARAALAAEAGALVARLPELLTLAFSDGTPLSHPSARGWLGVAGDARSVVPVASAEPEGDAERLAFEEALGMARDGRLEAAFDLLERPCAIRQGERGRYRARLRMASACAAAGNPLIARAMYEALYQEAGTAGLERWEPSLVVETLRGLVSAALAVKDDPRGATPRLNEYFQRLCALDPAGALQIWT